MTSLNVFFLPFCWGAITPIRSHAVKPKVKPDLRPQ